MDRVTVSVSLRRKLIERINRMVDDEKSPFHGNRSRLIDYYLERGLPPEGDIAVEMESKRR